MSSGTLRRLAEYKSCTGRYSGVPAEESLHQPDASAALKYVSTISTYADKLLDLKVSELKVLGEDALQLERAIGCVDAGLDALTQARSVLARMKKRGGA